MRKADLLRKVLEHSVPELKSNPDKLHLFIDDGIVIGTGAESASFEEQYTLNIIVTDFQQAPEVILVPIMDFIRFNQLELVENPERHKDGFRFTLDHNNNDSIDLAIYLKLTERILVRNEQDRYNIEYLNEPTRADNLTPCHWQCFLRDQLFAEWDSQDGR